MYNELDHEVVITGIGIVSPLGSNNDTIWENIQKKKTGIRETVSKDLCFNSGIPLISPIDYTADFSRLKNRKNKRFMRKNVLCFIEALRLAIGDAGIQDLMQEYHENIGIITTCGDSGTDFRIFLKSILQSIEDRGDEKVINMKKYGARGLHLQDPYFLMYDLVNSANCFSAIEYGSNGESNNFIMSGGTGFHSVKAGCESIKSGVSKIVITGAAESLLNGVEMLYLYNKFGLYTNEKEINTAVVPYSSKNQGLVFGEGAVTLILEDLEHAKNRGASVYGKISSYATCVDLNDDLLYADATGEGVRRCIEKCFSKSSDKKEIGENSLIITAGMALEDEDNGELNALKSLFSSEKGISYSTLKPNFGYIGPVSDLLDFSIGLLAMKKNCLPPVKNLGEKAINQQINFCREEQSKELQTLLSIAKGFGGVNSCMLVNKI